LGEATEKVIRVEPTASPSEDVGLYAEAHHRYRQLYPALNEI
jgi:hypothetical protein